MQSSDSPKNHRDTEPSQTHAYPSIATRLGWVSFFNDLSSEALARTVPLFLTGVLGTGPTIVGSIEGLAETINVLVKGFSGWFSDRVSSRKPLVVWGYSLSVFSRVLFAFAALSPISVALFRILDRVGKGIRSAPRDAMIADAASANFAGRDFGINRLLDALGAFAGLLVIALFGFGQSGLSEAEFRKICYISLPFGILSLCLLALWVPRLPTQKRLGKTVYFHIPVKTRGYLFVVFLFALANSSDAFLILRAQELGLGLGSTFLLMASFNFVTCLLAVPIGKMSDRFGRLRFLALGWIIYSISYTGFALTSTTGLFVTAVLFYGLFYGFTEGIEKALLYDLLDKSERGAGFGALQSVHACAALPASALTGLLMSRFGSQIALLTCAAISMCATFGLLIWGSMQRYVKISNS